jgi:dihydrofolate synthase/folylpolyglutamate synthase
MFYRLGSAALKPNLDNIIALCAILGNPQKAFKTIHIAGTNGKGSTSHMLASVLRENGYKTGLYTSPHLKDFRERIRIDGKMIDKKSVRQFINIHKKEIERIQPSFFEMTLALAFDFFRMHGVEYAVIETGLGGRLDSTNIILPELSLITNIGWDHMDLLGNTLEKIAGEKAGIIKKNIPVIISEFQESVSSVFIDKARSENAPLVFASETWEIQNWNHHQGYQEMDLHEIQSGNTYRLHLDLPGKYQLKNIKAVFSAVKILKERGLELQDIPTIRALRYIKKNTGLRGRWDILSRNPLIIGDTGHNLNGIKEVVEQISLTPHEKLHFVFGTLKDKDLNSLLPLLPRNASYYFCHADIPRALDSKILWEKASILGLKGDHFPTVKDALENAKIQASPKDLILIGGSTFVVAEIIP